MYNYILSILRENFKEISGKYKNYFIDNKGKIVATIGENIITMYYLTSSDIIWNHHDHVAVSIVKDFNVNGYMADVMFIEGLCGTCNDVRLEGNYFLECFYNRELSHLPLNNEQLISQNIFESLSYEEKIIWLQKITGANFTNANIEGISLSSVDNEVKFFGTCGCLKQSEDEIRFDICGKVIIDNIDKHLIGDYDNFNLFMISIKKTKNDIDYEKIYKFHRIRNDWYYNQGFNTAGSNKIRNFDSRRKYSTVDKIGSVHVNLEKSNIKYELDQIYKSNYQKSLNSKKLQMLYLLKNKLDYSKQQALEVIDSYNFEVRNKDVKELIKNR